MELPEAEKVVIFLEDSEDEYAKIADLAALLAFQQVPIRERRRERNRKRRERKRLLRKEMHAQQNKIPEEIAMNGLEKHEKVVIVLDDSGDEGATIRQDCIMDARKKRKHSNEEENGDRNDSNAYKTQAEEYKTFVDLTDYPNIDALLAFETPIMKRRRERNKKRRQRKKPRKELEARKNYSVKEGEQPDEVETVATTKVLETEAIPTTADIVPQKLYANAGEKKNLDSANKDADKAMPFNAKDVVKSSMVINVKSSSSERDVVIAEVDSSNRLRERALTEAIVKEEKQAQEINVYALHEGEQPDTVETVTTNSSETETIHTTENIVPEKLFVKNVEEEKQADLSKDAETTVSMEMVSVDNIVLRKLLRGPRYFDHSASGWVTSSNCDEEDRTTVNRVVQKRNKPCFICGGLEHKSKRCKQRRKCSKCGRGGHFAKECRKKQIDSKDSTICLNCGDTEHEMFSCSNDYSPDDLKEIQCYVCNTFGHLCCVDFIDEGPRQVSCYKCGQSGHLGSLLHVKECTRLRGKARASSLCYNCREEGHFARECTKQAKVEPEMGDLATQEGSLQKEKDVIGVKLATTERSLEKEREGVTGVKLAPREFHKSPKTKSENRKRVNMSENQGGWSGGWRNVHRPQNQIYGKPRANVWLSPAAAAIGTQYTRPTYPQGTSSEVGVSNGAHYMSPTYPRGNFSYHIGSPSPQAHPYGHHIGTTPNSQAYNHIDTSNSQVHQHYVTPTSSLAHHHIGAPNSQVHQHYVIPSSQAHHHIGTPNSQAHHHYVTPTSSQAHHQIGTPNSQVHHHIGTPTSSQAHHHFGTPNSQVHQQHYVTPSSQAHHHIGTPNPQAPHHFGTPNSQALQYNGH